MSVFVANEQADRPVDEAAVAALAQLVMEAEGVGESELSITVVDREYMTGLNQRFMGEDRPTDVLAFPMDGPEAVTGPPGGPTRPPGHPGEHPGGVDDFDDDDEELDDEPWLLGDVVLCPDYAADQAAKAGQTLEAELELLTVHGILHLIGMDHAEPEEERVMKARTDELLARWRSGAGPATDPAAGDGPRGGVPDA